MKNLLMPNDQKELYGNRLNEIGEHKIDSSLYNKIKSEIEALENVSTITYRTQGKIINFILTVSDETTLVDAKELGNAIITYFKEEDVKYYTFQIYIKKNDSKLDNFPIIGAKNPLTNEIIWTQDREISKEDDIDEK